MSKREAISNYISSLDWESLLNRMQFQHKLDSPVDLISLK